MFFIVLIVLGIISAALYIRYFPIRGIPCVSSLSTNEDIIKIVDVRDYNQAYKDSIRESINIPVAYLKRNYSELPKSKIIILASNHLEKNISIRFLRKRGFEIIGYSLTDCDCKKEIKQRTA
ncbi:rhodanese-like domain-containing protein [Sutcliffiella deserti]|uniref:hypothetical protein n=1 Tax=Sutcliffiella deserti TaxID=2875501 RepID=UPI001CC078B0|nr:hypothetical protein [Sutcliffiella deserti]